MSQSVVFALPLVYSLEEHAFEASSSDFLISVKTLPMQGADFWSELFRNLLYTMTEPLYLGVNRKTRKMALRS